MKLSEGFKKILLFLGGIVTGVVGILVYGSKSGRYKQAKAELKRIESELSSARKELERLTNQQRISETASNELRESIKHQSAIVSEIDRKLDDNKSILDDTESRLGDSRKYLAESIEILAKYADGDS